jgi:TonB family protein
VAQTQQVQTRAEAVLAKARRLSDIRSPNAPAFHLKATFSFVGDDLETIEGTYNEMWTSPSQWRREIAVGHSTHVEVRGLEKSWLLDQPQDFPHKATQVLGSLQLFPGSSAKLDFNSIAENDNVNPPTDCYITNPGTRREKSAFCFDRKSGVLLDRISPEFRRGTLFNYACEYGMFRQFGAYWFPREIACFEDRHKKIEVKIVDLSTAPSLSPDFFTPPAGSIEMGVCSVNPHPPVAVSTRDPNPPFRSRDSGGVPVIVQLSLVVDAQGKPQNVRLVRPGRKSLDESAISAVREWRFKPATCNGEPMALQIEVEVAFQLYR